MVRSQSERELTACGVSDYEYSFAIDWILAPELAEKLVRGSYILEAAGPAASGSANAPVLDVEGKKSRLR